MEQTEKQKRDKDILRAEIKFYTEPLKKEIETLKDEVKLLKKRHIYDPNLKRT